MDFGMPPTRSYLTEFVLRVLLPTVLAACGIAALMLYIVNGIFVETNKLDAQAARRAANSALASLRDVMEATVQDNANWDDAATASQKEGSATWFRETWGYATADGLYDTVYVSTLDGKTIYGAHNGEDVSQRADAYFGPDIGEMIADLPRDGTAFGNVSGQFLIDGQLVIATAAPIVPHSDGKTVASSSLQFLVFSKVLDPLTLDRLSRRFGLENLSVRAPGRPSSNAVSVLSPRGLTIAQLGWTERSPGEIVRSKYDDIVSILLALFLFVIAVLLFTSWKGYRDAHRSQVEAVSRSLRDDLTGLANRRELATVLATRLTMERETGGGLSLVYADLDGFKEVNDSYGHEIGDLLLKSVAAGFAHLASGADVVARLGGDEFAIVVSGVASAEKARELARNMIAFLNEPMTFSGRVASVSVSAGIVDVDNDPIDAEEIIRRADVAMYAAKAAGRNRLYVYSKSLDQKRDENRAISKALREHIDQGNLTVVYQPIVDARTRRIRGVEALVRWPKNTKVHYTPDKFVPVAEEFGMIEDLGYFVLSEACRQAAQWPDIFVSVNVSPIQFMNPLFADLVEKTLRKTGLEPSRLEIEVTEGFIIDNAERANAIINRLHDMRVGVALDDFGTGFSSIGHLRRFKFDKLKLDRSMVVDVLRQPSALRLVQGTIAMADALGLVVVAEGIEDENQVSVLRLAGCSQFQGFLFSRPVEPWQITQIIQGHSAVAMAS